MRFCWHWLLLRWQVYIPHGKRHVCKSSTRYVRISKDRESYMFKLAFRNIFRNRLRTALTLAAIITGVTAIIISGGFVEDVFVQLRESTIHSRIGHVQIFRSGYIEYA